MRTELPGSCRWRAPLTGQLLTLAAGGYLAPYLRRWRVTSYGRQAMGTSLHLREHHFRNLYSNAAAV